MITMLTAFSAILSFLGGSAFRMLWGEVSTWFNKAQDHKHEIELMELQEKCAAAQHARNLDSIRLQAELGVQEIRVQGEIDLARLTAETEKQNDGTWGAAALQAMKPIGIWFVDAWNAAIRPSAASLALFLWFQAVNNQHWVMTARDEQLVFAVLGFFFADRTLAKRGK